MMFGGLFGGRGKGGDAPAPAASHACDLNPGGFLKLGFVAPEGLARADLQVAAVHAVDLGGAVRRVLAVEAVGLGRLEMWRDERGAIALARPLDRPDVARLFDLDSFARLFDPDEPANLVIERIAEPAGFDGWTAPRYRQEAAREAYRHDADPARTAIGAALDKDVRAFDFYRLVSDRRGHALEARVHDGGRTDVALVALLPETVVEEIWPG